MHAIDTNLLVRLLVRDDLEQTKRAEAFVAKGAWVSHLVLAETLWVLESVYGLDAKKQAITVQMLLEHAQISLQESDVVAAALAIFQRRAKVNFSDCLILEIAHKAGHSPLGTFDRALSKINGTALV